MVFTKQHSKEAVNKYGDLASRSVIRAQEGQDLFLPVLGQWISHVAHFWLVSEICEDRAHHMVVNVSYF